MMFRNYLRTALGNLLRNKLFSLINWLQEGNSVNANVNGRVGIKNVETCNGNTVQQPADNSGQTNHIGNFDPIVLVAAMRTRRLAPRLMAAAGLFRVPVVGAVLRACGHIPVHRRSTSAAEALHAAEAALNAREAWSTAAKVTSSS